MYLPLPRGGGGGSGHMSHNAPPPTSSNTAAMRTHLARNNRRVSSVTPPPAALAQVLRIGVHLRAAQLMQLDVRPLAEGMRVGASCHTLDELRRAESLGCDFVVVGPVADTLTHPDATPLGWTGFAALREEVALPMYAIGGLGAQDIEVARAHGAQGIAAIRGLWPT